MELKWCSAHRMAECQRGRMKGLAWGRALQQVSHPARCPGDPSAAPTGIHRIANNRVSQVLQMHPNLVSPAGMELQSE